MKKYFFLSLIAFACVAYGMINVPTAPEIDPAIMQAHELKALKSQEAPFHEKNSFLDAYMNPSNFVAIEQDTINFPHYKYSHILYNLRWEVALKTLQDATNECKALTQQSRQNNTEHPLIIALQKEPFQKFSEKQRYELQLLFLNAYQENKDLELEKNEGTEIANIILNRGCYANAFNARDVKKVSEYSMTELRAHPFENLSSRIDELRLLAIMKTSMQGSIMVSVLGGMSKSHECIIS